MTIGPKSYWSLCRDAARCILPLLYFSPDDKKHPSNRGRERHGTGSYAVLCTKRLADVSGIAVMLVDNLVERVCAQEQFNEDRRRAAVESLQRSALYVLLR